ncbi:MAG: hypothetical protein R6V61_00715 [Wenzhouxiangellaceae bacterium]
MSFDAEFVYTAHMVVAYGMLLYMVVISLLRPDERKRFLSSLSEWRPRVLFLGLVLILVGASSPALDFIFQESESRVRWAHALLNLILLLMGLWFSGAMIRNWWSRNSERESDGSAS